MKKSKLSNWFIAASISIIGVTGCANVGANNQKDVAFKNRAGWAPLITLALDDCKTWNAKGKSLINWAGETCGPDGLIKVINKNQDMIPVFYAAYHEYGARDINSPDVRNLTKFKQLNYLYELAKKLESPAVVTDIYNDYVIDRKGMGLADVPSATFVKKLKDFSLLKNDIYAQMNEVAKADYEKSIATRGSEKLGVDYKTVCGPYTIDLSPSDGLSRINGVIPETQKIRRLTTGNASDAKGDPDNIKMEWTVATDQPGRWVGLEYIKRDGKAILNAQWLQASMNAPRQYATYDCVKVKE